MVHPQFWPTDLDYTNKRVVIVGSGATAVTLLPAMYENGAARVTMVQRSPGYFCSIPSVVPVDNFIRKWLPSGLTHRLIRFRHLLLGYLFVYFCHFFPKQATRLLHSSTEKELPPTIPLDPHFIPSYRPWEQRMCLSPDGDFFQALRSGKADVVTDHIETVTKTGIKFKSGKSIDADIIVTATGLKIQLCGNATVSVNGQGINLGDKFAWRSSMIQDVPNLAFLTGYIDATWTLGSDVAARTFVRLLSMKKQGATIVVPTVNDPSSIKPVEFLNSKSTYIQAAAKKKLFPKGGHVAPRKPRRSYFADWWFASFGDIANGLWFNHGPT